MLLSGLSIREHVPLAPFTTLGVGGPARFFAIARGEEDVVAAVAWARDRGLALFVLGGGSNLLVRDSGFDGLVLQIALRGLTDCGPRTETAAGFACLDAAAGEPWEAVVDYAISRNLAGIECLAGIPGSVGGTPVQNVGAYGQEVAETIESVRAFDLGVAYERDPHSSVRPDPSGDPGSSLRPDSSRGEAWVELGNADCRFRYRASLFNTDQPGRFIVTRVRFRLRRDGAPNLRYADLQRRFADGVQPTLAEVARTVREIRRAKGMLLVESDPDCRSAGSFFKNPIVAADRLDPLAAAAGLRPDQVPHWAAGPEVMKLPAAWLLEQAGFVKGYRDGASGISSRHTLALINRGGATCADIERLQQAVVAAVAGRFGITLEREPVLVG